MLNEKEGKFDYTFATLVSPGIINVYLRITYESVSMPQMGGGNSSTQQLKKHYYLKKGSKIFSLKNVEKKESKGIITDLFNDDELLLDKLAVVKYSSDEIIKLVKEYNVKHYEKSAKPLDVQGKITFYRIKGGKHKTWLPILIDDQEYSINPYEIKLLELSAENPVKVCIGSDQFKQCELMKGSLSYVPYFEILKDKKGEIKLVQRKEKDAFRHIQYIRSK